jgi:hypothetical protein
MSLDIRRAATRGIRMGLAISFGADGRPGVGVIVAHIGVIVAHIGVVAAGICAR